MTSKQVRAVVAFSFGMRDMPSEPNPCNVRLARAAERIVERQAGDTLLIAQWEIAKQLKRDGAHVYRVVSSADGEYLDTDKVWQKALDSLTCHNVDSVIPVAQPFLHRHKIGKLIRDSGISVKREPVGWIGFDSSKDNLQWWTKGPIRLIAYSIMQALGREPGGAADIR
jgi:hypothetical protein